MQKPRQPLRIALIASSLKLAGAEKQTAYLARALWESETDVRFYYLGEGGHYEKVLRQTGMPFTQIFKARHPLTMLVQLSRQLRAFRPQIAFAPQFGDLLQVGLAGRLCGALVLGGVRSDGFYELNAHRRRAPWMLRLAHGLVANSHCGRQNLIRQGVDASKIVMLPNVLDVTDFDGRAMEGPPMAIPDGRIAAVAIGSLQPCKRFDRFLRALALARQKAPQLMGILVGADRGEGPALAREARKLNLLPHDVLFLGECHSVPAILTQAGMLVLCSDYEGFPNVILEAMAARLPVLTTPVGDAERIVLHSQTGYVVSGNDLRAMATHMVQLASSPETRTRLGAEGRKWVTSHYEYGALSFRLLCLLHGFADRHKRADPLSPVATTHNPATMQAGGDAPPIPTSP